MCGCVICVCLRNTEWHDWIRWCVEWRAGSTGDSWRVFALVQEGHHGSFDRVVKAYTPHPESSGCIQWIFGREMNVSFWWIKYWGGASELNMGGDLTTTPSDLFFCCSNRHLHPFPFFLYFVAFLFSSCFLLASSDSAFPPGFLHLPSLLQVANSARGNMGIFPKRLWLAQVVTIIPVWIGAPHQASGTLWVCTPAGCLGGSCMVPRGCWDASTEVGAGHSWWMHTSGCCFWGGFEKDDSLSEEGCEQLALGMLWVQKSVRKRRYT